MAHHTHWDSYPHEGFFDELIGDDGAPRPEFTGVTSFLESLSLEELRDRQQAAEVAIRSMGITFTVYSDEDDIDRQWPFDIIPRIITTDE